MKKYFLENKKVLAAYLIITPCMAISSALFAKSMEPLFDGTTIREGSIMIKAIILFIVLGVMDLLFYYLHKVIRENFRCNFLIAVKRDSIAGILNMDYSEYWENSPSYYISLFQRDINRINKDYFDSVCGIYRVTTAFIVTFLVLIIYNPWICIINVVIAAISVLVPKIFEKRIEQLSTEATERAAEYQTTLSDVLSGFNTIRLFSVVGQIKKQTNERNIRNEHSEKARILANFSFSYISMIFTQLGYIFTIVAGIIMVFYGKMTVGGVIAVSQLIGGILAPFEELPEFCTNLKSVQSVKEKVLSYIHINEQNIEDLGANLREANIVLNNIEVKYDDKTVLKGINTVFKQDKKYIIMGESGCGKSTLAKVLLKMVPVSCGSIEVGEKNIGQLSESSLYHTINYMQQEVFLFDDTIYNNITLYKVYPIEKVNQAIEDAGLREYIDGLKDGLNSVINGNGYNLSGGQKQRIGIARSLLAGAKVIVLDEITSNLDVVLGKKIEDVVFGLKNVTVIWITHKINSDTMRMADEIIVLKDGVVEEQGTYDDLLAQKGLLYSYKVIAG